ncbi:hypothetical protein PTTG_10873 [Puccinia triticina 1-1 BBBD Race 1]|uniref:Uncharacterized protein n=1 Tax=Puccinia triticina (isolate 1-1 / race 1 (BBBD)) TaxID=630390 RepID=A0A0C4FCC1_PUCT1|nr:hypothetical protein PTTG_10873 [Puccinia triticina 1-1 BBBD Race 1]
MSEDKELTRIRLTSENYLVWLVQIEARLFRLDVRDVIIGNTAKPENSGEQAAWTKKNQLGYVEIIESLDSKNTAYVGAATPVNHKFDGQYVWNLLKLKYAADDDVAKVVALEDFLGIKYSTIPKFVSDMRKANQKLILAGMDLGNRMRNLMVLARLPRDQFQLFRDVITMGFSGENFESLLRRLENHGAQNKIGNEGDFRPSQAALFTISSGQLTCPSCKKTFKVCTHCQKTGHSADTCYQKHPDKRPTSSSTPQVHFAAIAPTNEDEQAYFLSL